MRNKYPVAVHLFFMLESQVLLLRRFNTGYEDGKYSVVAGHVDAGETVTQAAIREAKEEVGASLRGQDLEVAHVMHRRSEDERIDFFIAWYPVDGLPENTIPYVRHAVEGYQQGLHYSEFGW